jgi:hypothetical protein
MFDSPITLLLLGISAASAIATFTAARRRRRTRPAPPALATLSDGDLLAALASLDPQATNAQTTAQRRATHTTHHSISVTHPAPEMREPNHPASVSSVIDQNHEVRRRLTLFIIEEIERRQVRTER